MEEELDLGHILSDDEVASLLGEISNDNPNEEEDNNNQAAETQEEEEKESEEVGSEEEKEEDTPTDDGKGSSAFFSSIANAFMEEGIFPNINEDTIKNVKDAKDLRELINAQIQAELTEQQQRVAEALNNDVAPSEIRRYESVLQYLESIDNSMLENEEQEGEKLRRNIIKQDYLNRGFSEKRADKEVERSFQNGTDIEDAKEALSGNLEFIKNRYDNLLNEAKKAKREEEEKKKNRLQQMQKDMETKEYEMFAGMSISKDLRKKAFEAVTKPVYKDEDGNYYTAVQKLKQENPEEFLAKIGLIYSLTNGFKSFEGIVDNKVKKAVKKGFSDLENKLNTTRRDSAGNLKLATGVSQDEESYLSDNFEIDI
jgi:hypothetical protein